jgi:hypothetical protein
MATFPLSTKHRHGNRRMLYLIEQYSKAHPDEIGPVDPDAVSSWAIDNGIYKPKPIDPKQILRRAIRTALRDDYTEDPQGREVRANQPEMVEVRTPDGLRWRSKWWRTFEMPPEKMRTAGQLRRRGAFNDVYQIHIDFTSYNDNNVFGAQLDNLDFNFNKDIEEADLPTEYPDADGPTLEAEDEEDEDI